MKDGFGKLSQLRTDDQVVEDYRKVEILMNAILEELAERGYNVELHVIPYYPTVLDVTKPKPAKIQIRTDIKP